MKRIFTPYAQGVGNLGGRLPYVGTKPDVVGKPTGRTKGFKPDEYIFAPAKVGDAYVKTNQLENLLTPDDQLYINAHCSKGLDYLSCQEKCPPDKKVTIPDLIAQLEALRLHKETQAKIKFWICEGALDNGVNQSFCQRFSAAFDDAGYKACRIFGYSLSVFSEYKEVDGEKRKRTVTSIKSRIEAAIPRFDEVLAKWKAKKPETMSMVELRALYKDINASQLPDIKNYKDQHCVWVLALMGNVGNREKAIDSIVGKPLSVEAFQLGPGGVGDRASKSRVEFKAGRIVP